MVKYLLRKYFKKIDINDVSKKQLAGSKRWSKKARKDLNEIKLGAIGRRIHCNVKDIKLNKAYDCVYTSWGLCNVEDYDLPPLFE